MSLNVLRALRVSLLFAAPVLFAQSPSAPVAPLTQQQAVEQARLTNPTLIAARRHVSATRSTEITAGLRQNPVLTLLGQEVTLPEVNPAGNPYYYSANISRLFERGQKRRWRLESATATADVTDSQYRDQERQVVLNLRQAFTNLLVAKEAIAVANENLADYRKTVEPSKSRLDAGDIPRTDYERIDLQLAQFESDADNATLNMLQASAQLQVLLGISQPANVGNLL
jgi:cobalt-zinc-cadmium efflux system outer membrane protein